MPVQPDPDAALMLRVKRGDRAAFTELVEKYKQPVMNFSSARCATKAEAEDLAQNVFLQVYQIRAPATSARRNFPPGFSPSRATCA